MATFSIRAIFHKQMTGTLLAGVLLAFAGRASATTITTTSYATWNSSTYTTGVHSFLNFYPVTQSLYNTASGITLTPSGSSTAFQFTGVDNGSYYLAGDGTQKTLSGSSNAGSYLEIDFPTVGENSFLLGTGASTAKPLTFTLSDGQSFTVTTTVFGVSLSSPVSWMRLSAPAGSPAMVSDFYYAASALQQDSPTGTIPAATPEPATVIMTCAGGLLLLASIRRRTLSPTPTA